MRALTVMACDDSTNGINNCDTCSYSDGVVSCSSCENYYYRYETDNHYICGTCSESISHCASCYIISYYQISSCNTCEDGYYISWDNNHYICEECSNSLNNCESCYWNGYNLLSCGTCSAGYYRDLSNNHYICTGLYFNDYIFF
ncbi:hypothetical protein QTN25_008428 [Entamoeba marina]